MYDNYPPEVDDIIHEDNQRRAYLRQLSKHPDYRDPNHPEPEDFGLKYNEEHQLELDL